MVALKNIHSLSDFVRHSKSHLARLSRTGEPAVLTVNGEARAVVLSADAYQKLVDDAELAENLEIIEEGMREAKQGKGIPGSELIRRLRGATPSEEIGMKYEVIAQARAVAEAEEARAEMAARDSETAEQWITEMDLLFKKLSFLPNRFPMAPESPHTNYVVRHVLVGKYRVLFAVDDRKVYILRIRHSRRKPFKPGELD